MGELEVKDIVLLGDGWGALAAYKSLICVFPKLKVVTKDRSLCVCSSLDENDIYSFKNNLLIFSGYKPIVPATVLQDNLCINIHYSLLPKYRGLHSTVWAILNGESELGLTIHLMSKYIDDGPIIHQYKVNNDFSKTSREYMECFNNYIEAHLGKIIIDYLHDEVQPIQQNKYLATWVGRRKKEDCLIDFNKSLKYQRAFFRALVDPYPLPFIKYKDNEYIVTQVAFHEMNVETHIGRILNIDNEGVWVKCLDGYLIIKEMIDKCGNKVHLEDFKIGVFLNK